MTRYFLRKINENIFIEIDEQQYIDWTSNIIDSNIYLAAKIQWAITGNKQTTQVGAVLVPGVVEQNIAAASQAERILPGISSYLSNPLQYYTDTDFKVPRDINA